MNSSCDSPAGVLESASPPINIVLVRPKRGGNVAATARAMKNMGLARLTLVEACVPSAEERALAYGALDVLDAARRASSLSEALADCVFVAGTSSRASREDWTPRRFAAEAMRRSSSGTVAVVFGPEDNGLRREELRLCHVRLRIPSAPSHPSLNLAQAALVVAYELRMAILQTPALPRRQRATLAELQRCFGAWRESLLTIGYLNPDNPDAILSELRGMIVRSDPTPREISLLRGVARQMLWAVNSRFVADHDPAMSGESVRESRSHHDRRR